MMKGMKTIISKVYEALKAENIQRDVPLKTMTSFGIGGNAALVYYPGSNEALARALALVQELDCPFHIMGNGSNVLAPDAGYPGLIICLNQARTPLIVEESGRVTADAGMHLKDLAAETVERGFMGLEPLCGIPGTVGGAVAMNAGAYGTEISEHLVELTILENGAIRQVETCASDFGFRKSRYSAPNTIVLSATFQLPRDNGTAKALMEDCTKRRAAKQPLSYPSGGSVFKRPAGHYAGCLIEQCSLKGTRIGGAEVSMQHAGFIINVDNATEKDVLELIALIQHRVRRETGVRLERELKRLCEI